MFFEMEYSRSTRLTHGRTELLVLELVEEEQMEFDIYSNDQTMLYIIIALGATTVLIIIFLFSYCCCCRTTKKKEVVKSTSDACQGSFNVEPEHNYQRRRETFK
jgi:hypothetical protein